MKSKYKSGDILGCYKLLEFSHLKKRDYYWYIKCIKCNQKYLRSINKTSMSKTKFCNSCKTGKYVNYKTPEEYIKAKIKIDENDCWLWKGHIGKRSGYCQSKYRHIHKSAHHLSYETFKGEIPKGMCVCHTCDVRHCVNPTHLWLGTYSDNVRDCIKKGRNNPPQGEKCGTSKLKKTTVIKIFKLKKQGMQQKDISFLLKIPRSTICHILKRKTWKHLDNK